MKAAIHPTMHRVTLACACGNKFETLSTKENVSTEICSNCHPFYTGEQRFLDSAQRLEKFKDKEAKKAAIAQTGPQRSKKEKEAERKAKRSTGADTKQSAKDALKAAKNALSDL
jgi:large subunit ribosomal protein L31